MGLFHTDSVALSYSNVEAAKQWWIHTFGCKMLRARQEWDNPLPSDVDSRRGRACSFSSSLDGNTEANSSHQPLQPFLSVDASTRSALRLGAVLFRIVYYIPSRSSNYGSAIRWRSACSDPRPTRVCGSVCIRIRRRRSGWRKIAIHQQPSGQPGRSLVCVNAYMRMLF